MVQEMHVLKLETTSKRGSQEEAKSWNILGIVLLGYAFSMPHFELFPKNG